MQLTSYKGTIQYSNMHNTYNVCKIIFLFFECYLPNGFCALELSKIKGFYIYNYGRTNVLKNLNF
jgi:hypothetical protein